MTVREYLNTLLDMPLWQFVLGLAVAAFLCGFLSALAEDWRVWRSRRR